MHRRIVFATVLAVVCGTAVTGSEAKSAPHTTFVDYAQCANGAPPTSSLACPAGWTTGILTAANSHFAEDQVTPQRAQVLVPAGAKATGHTLTFRYQTRSAGAHGYDSLATWNYSQAAAHHCQGLPPGQCVGGPASTYPIPDDPAAVSHLVPAGPGREMTMYGGTITGVSVPKHDRAATSGESFATVTVTYSVADTRAARRVQLLFGGHLAAGTGRRGWGPGLGSANANAGPYRIRWEAADGVAVNRDNQVQGSAIVVPPQLVVSATADAAEASATQPVGFTIRVQNVGGASASNATIVDSLPAAAGLDWSLTPYAGPGSCAVTGAAPKPQSLDCNLGDLAPGVVATVHVTSPTTAATSGTLFNTATTQAGDNSPVSATASVHVVLPQLVVTNIADESSVVAGDPVGFRLGATNRGTGTAFGATLTDTLPVAEGLAWSIDPPYAGPGGCAIDGAAPQQTLSCSFGDLAPGAAAGVHVGSPSTAATVGSLTNVATARATSGSSSTATATIAVDPAKLEIAKVADAATVNSADAIGFTVTVTSHGRGSAVTLEDPLPAAAGVDWRVSPDYSGRGTCGIDGSAPAQKLSCTFGDVPKGASMSVHVTSATTAETSGPLASTAVARAANLEAVEAAATVTVNRPELIADNASDTQAVDTLAPIGFTVTVGNLGPGTALETTVADPLPPAMGVDWAIDPAYAGPGSCAVVASPSGQTLVCSLGDLAPGTFASVHVTSATRRESAGWLASTVTTQARNHPIVTATATVRVDRPHLVAGVAGCTSGSDAGTQVAYSLSYENDGTAPAYDATLVDTLPPGVTVIDAGGGEVAADGRSVTWALGTVAVGDSGLRTLTVAVPPDLSDALLDAVSLSASNALSAIDDVTTPASAGTVEATGRAYGVAADLAGGTQTVDPTPDTDVKNPDQVQNVEAGPGVVLADLVQVTRSAATEDGQSLATAIATTGAVTVTVGPVVLRASALVARSESHAGGATAGSSLAGSRVADLVVNGERYGDVDSPKTITVTNPETGDPVATVHVLEQSARAAANGTPQPQADGFRSGLTVDAIRVVVDTPAGPSQIVLGSASTDAGYPLVGCDVPVDRIGGDARVFQTAGVPPSGGTTVGLVVLPATGGSADATAADLAPAGTAGAAHTEGTLDPRHVLSVAKATDLLLADGAVSLRMARATATGDGRTASGTTVLADLVVDGTDVCATLEAGDTCSPAPNTVVALPVGTLVLNEQVPGADGQLRVTAVHLYLDAGAEILIASAYADTSA